MAVAARTLLTLSLAVVAIYNVAAQKSAAECVRHSDCSAGQCCTIAFERYSYPRCSALLAEGAACRPGGPLVTNGSRYYPDMTEIVLDNVYLMFCPCGNGLTCDKDGVCREDSKSNLVAGN